MQAPHNPYYEKEKAEGMGLHLYVNAVSAPSFVLRELHRKVCFDDMTHSCTNFTAGGKLSLPGADWEFFFDYVHQCFDHKPEE